MIVTDASRRDEFIYVVDPGDMRELDTQREFIEWVDNAEIELIPSSRYWNIKDAVERGVTSIYSGYKFQFWAKSRADAQVFYDRWPWRMWCEKRHPEPRRMTLKASVMRAKTKMWNSDELETCWVLAIENVPMRSTIGQHILDTYRDPNSLDRKLGPARYQTLKGWIDDGAAARVIHYSLQDGMNKLGRDVMIATGDDAIVVNCPEIDEEAKLTEFDIEVVYTVPIDEE